MGSHTLYMQAAILKLLHQYMCSCYCILRLILLEIEIEMKS